MYAPSSHVPNQLAMTPACHVPTCPILAYLLCVFVYHWYIEEFGGKMSRCLWQVEGMYSPVTHSDMAGGFGWTSGELCQGARHYSKGLIRKTSTPELGPRITNSPKLQWCWRLFASECCIAGRLPETSPSPQTPHALPSPVRTSSMIVPGSSVAVLTARPRLSYLNLIYWHIPSDILLYFPRYTLVSWIDCLITGV